MRKLLIWFSMVTLLLLVATLALPAAAAPNVCRDLPTEDQVAGAEITVSLAVTDVNGVDWHLVDEAIPPGLTVVDAGGASTETPGHLKWSATSPSPDVTHTYTVTGSAGTYTFDGVYQVSGGDETLIINCDTVLKMAGESTTGDAVTSTTSTPTTTRTSTQPVSEENVTPETPAITETNTQPVSGETVTPATPTSTITETNTPVTTPTKKLATKPGTKGLPGFEAMFVIAGLLAVAYLIRNRS